MIAWLHVTFVIFAWHLLLPTGISLYVAFTIFIFLSLKEASRLSNDITPVPFGTLFFASNLSSTGTASQR
jgi:hypothetical protein